MSFSSHLLESDTVELGNLGWWIRDQIQLQKNHKD